MKEYIIWTAGKYLQVWLEVITTVVDGLGEMAMYYMER